MRCVPSACAIALACVATSCAPVRAQVAFGLAPYAGARTLDPSLDDYRWNVRPARLLGAEAWLSASRLEAAVAVERSSTEQATGIPGQDEAPRVDLTHLALRLRARVVSVGPVHLHAGAGFGRLHFAWNPERTTYEIEGLATPLEVHYAPLDTWRSELEAGARIALPGPVDLVLASTWARFALATAHRSGEEIVERDETFSTFDARIHLSWSLWGER